MRFQMQEAEDVVIKREYSMYPNDGATISPQAKGHKLQEGDSTT
ncbi:MAG: hypothetical protein ANABAC_1779 [Anaerolineae bacterium]|nr:MAG: hypothetical protein ANABAC_1779 [Anaerolineae bacterium]